MKNLFTYVRDQGSATYRSNYLAFHILQLVGLLSGKGGNMARLLMSS